MAETRSSSRRSVGRGTAVDSETVVDSNAASLTPLFGLGGLPADQGSKHVERLQARTQIASKWDFMDSRVKRAFPPLTRSAVEAHAAAAAREEARMSQPRLLLIDDEPALAEFLATAAEDCGFVPRHHLARRGIPRANSSPMRPDMVALDLGMPGMDGVELLRFLAEQDYRSPVLIVSGFDRRVLESAFRLGEALGLDMVGPLEKPVRLEELESDAGPAAGDDGSVTRKSDKALVAALARALEEQQLRMAYQPKVSLRDGSLMRVEALVRWDDPELGAVEPSLFIPLAEQHGLIDDLTLWGLRTILRQWVDWRDDGLDTSIAFNISALSLQHLDFPDLVERMCRALDVPTDRLVLELTEGATQPLVKLMDTLTRFRIKGIGLAIDDFGTGYSSLMQLRQLPFSEVKIDQAFVADVHRSRDCRLIIRGITDLAHGLGLIATAEGVETVEQLRAVQELGCDLVQGYLISPPMEPRQLKAWKQEFRSALAVADGRRQSRFMERCRSGCPGPAVGRARN